MVLDQHLFFGCNNVDIGNQIATNYGDAMAHNGRIETISEGSSSIASPNSIARYWIHVGSSHSIASILENVIQKCTSNIGLYSGNI